MKTIRVGIVGLGANTRLRHVPGLLACENVEITAVCNRRPESTKAAAAEFGIPNTFDTWQQLVADPDIDAIVVGTWPYLHCPISVAALEAGKHVLTEARMAMNAAEARQMLDTSTRHPELVAQIVPSPFGLFAGQVVSDLLADGYIGELREAVVLGTGAGVADAASPIHWRQSAQYSGLNMLALGIAHETLIRWIDDPIEVLAATATFTSTRPNKTSGKAESVGTPDSVHVLTQLPSGARGIYHLSGAIHFGPPLQIHLYGSEGTLKYELLPKDRLWGGRAGDEKLAEIEIPVAKQQFWRVEADFVDAIRNEKQVQLTDFATGARYMQFTEAVAQSAKRKAAVAIT